MLYLETAEGKTQGVGIDVVQPRGEVDVATGATTDLLVAEVKVRIVDSNTIEVEVRRHENDPTVKFVVT